MLRVKKSRDPNCFDLLGCSLARALGQSHPPCRAKPQVFRTLSLKQFCYRISIYIFRRLLAVVDLSLLCCHFRHYCRDAVLLQVDHIIRGTSYLVQLSGIGCLSRNQWRHSRAAQTRQRNLSNLEGLRPTLVGSLTNVDLDSQKFYIF